MDERQTFPLLADNLDDILPKKTPLIIAKCPGHVNFVVVENKPVVFQVRDGPWFPTLRILHQYPDIMPKLRVDRGAIKFVLSGANIMCPGLTSKGAEMEDVPVDTAVAIMAEGKELALAVGLTKMSTEDIRKVNKGIGVELTHYLNDGLWKTQTVE
eukprot:jgi/Mesvir1/21078/Mv17231-RA.1